MFWNKLAANPWELMPSMKNSQCHVLLQTYTLESHNVKMILVMLMTKGKIERKKK
jgi:hypothetical protein